eukprot:813650-Rhodomonas_salina.1
MTYSYRACCTSSVLPPPRTHDHLSPPVLQRQLCSASSDGASVQTIVTAASFAASFAGSSLAC